MPRQDKPATADKQAPVKLTDRAIQALKPGSEPYRVTDGGCPGLFLIVHPSGQKIWRVIYARAGLRKLYRLGDYPAMSLLEARSARLEVRRLVAAGGDPQHERTTAKEARLERNGQTVAALARNYHAQQAKHAWSGTTGYNFLKRLERHIIPAIGAKPITLVTRNTIIDLLVHVRDVSGPAEANATRQLLDALFNEWLDRGLIVANPVARLAKRTRTPDRQPQPAALTIEQARDVLWAMETSTASAMLKLLHRFMALTGMRPSEVRGAVWHELASPGIWHIPGARMKGRRGRKIPHTVYLSPAALDVLEVARALAPMNAVYVFPSDYRRGKHAPFERSTMAGRLKATLGEREHVAHGWRASLATILNAQFPADRQVIDAMIAHKSPGREVSAAEPAYNRTTASHYAERARYLGTQWAELLLAGMPSARALAGLPAPNVVPLAGRRKAA